MKFQIKSIYGCLLFEADCSSLAECVLAAVKSDAYLTGADLTGAYLTGADLTGANLTRTNLTRTNLTGANLTGAYLTGAKAAERAIAQTRILPEGEIIGWKKCADGTIAKLLIPAKAKRSHAFGRKCRAEWVEVLELSKDGKPVEEACAAYDNGKTVYRVGKTVYRVGKIVKPDSWSDDWQTECAPGIHFFITKIEAEEYTP